RLSVLRPGSKGAERSEMAAGSIQISRLDGRNIGCNAVCPGNIVTPMTMNMDQSKIDKRMIGAMSKHNDLTIRPCMPEDVANIIAFLASDASKALTGQIIVSDFGASL
ncbi:MAG: SDR family oxidoreductase, partial [Firmicutes bacterium]|nr:SDR family oxidoreductase [Bacillota bacterium]